MAKKTKDLPATPRKTTRLQYGTGPIPLFWTVKVKDAKKDVTINGTFMDAINGTAGETIGCHLSNCSWKNSDKFPHPFVLAAFTKTCAIVVTKVTNGAPSHAVRYMHSYAKLVELNDTDKTRETIRNNPELAERQFVLRAPTGNKRKGAVHRTDTVRDGRHTGKHLPYVPRGALARAQAAKLVTADLARVLKKATDVA